MRNIIDKASYMISLTFGRAVRSLLMKLSNINLLLFTAKVSQSD